MGYLSKGVQRAVWVAAAVLFALALPVFGANSWWAVLKAAGVPPGAPLQALALLVALPVFLLVAWVVHRIAFAAGRRAPGQVLKK